MFQFSCRFAHTEQNVAGTHCICFAILSHWMTSLTDLAFR